MDEAIAEAEAILHGMTSDCRRAAAGMARASPSLSRAFAELEERIRFLGWRVRMEALMSGAGEPAVAA